MLFNFFFSRVFLSCVCVSWGVFVPLNEIVLYCIAFYSICNKCVTRRLVIENRKLQKNKYTAKRNRRRADKLSAAARRSTKVGGGAHKLSAAARPAHGSSLRLLLL